ncbi:MAG: AraC family transcriptional regulator [Oscillospiraceae bacterium]
MKRQELKHYSLDKATNASLWVCQCGWEKCDSGHKFGPAVRDHYLIHYIVSGSGRYKNASGEYYLTKGQGFLISPSEVTIYTADDEEPWEYYWVGFKGVDAKHILSRCALDEKNPIFCYEETHKFKALFIKMFEAFKSNRAREYAMLAYLYLILTDLMAQVKPQSLPSSNVKVYLNSALEYINDNYSYDINVKSLATHIGIDRTYLYRIFVENIELSPEQYLLKTRMTKAANLLKTTEYSVLQVALSTGYKDLSHFSNIFKKFFGVSPSNYRK